MEEFGRRLGRKTPVSSVRQTPLMSAQNSVLDEGMQPWAPPQPAPPLSVPSDNSSFIIVHNLPLSASPEAPHVFKRLTMDTTRRNEAKRKLDAYRKRTADEEVKSLRRSKPPGKQSSDVYMRLVRDAKNRTVQTSASRKEIVVPRLKLPKERTENLVNRLIEDAKTRSQRLESTQREQEETKRSTAILLANKRHQRTPDAAVQQRLVSPRKKHSDTQESATSSGRVFTKEESRMAGERLMNAHSKFSRPAVQRELRMEHKISPKQADELVGRLYSHRSRLTSTRHPTLSPEMRGDSVLAQVFGTDRSVQSFSHDSLRGKDIEDLDDMLLRIKAKAAPEERDSIQDSRASASRKRLAQGNGRQPKRQQSQKQRKSLQPEPDSPSIIEDKRKEVRPAVLAQVPSPMQTFKALLALNKK